MLTPEQEIGIHVVKEAFTLIAEELKQFWKSKREKQKKDNSDKGQVNNGVSAELQNNVLDHIKDWQNEAQLKMLVEDLKTAIEMAAKYNTRMNKYKMSKPSSLDPVAVEMKIEETEKDRDQAIEDIKKVLETLSREEILISND